jgi:hypothetical protein
LEVGVEPRYREYTGDDPVGFVISLNLNRRHLNESQRAVIAARLANMPRGGDTGKNQYGEWQSANLPNGKISQSTAAELLNVSPRIIRSVKAVEREAPELIKRLSYAHISAGASESEHPALLDVGESL